ncbi:hypothetical protein HKX48_005154 [Thoreauomyces humboldtii]|nr:hypothetical protein HKX48_005154 [Thoreauomyces humboldtii]
MPFLVAGNLIVFLGLLAIVRGQTLQTTYVSPSGLDTATCGTSLSTACATLTAAVGRTTDGGVVNLGPGTYTGVGNINVALDGRPMTIQSTEGAASTILDAGLAGRLMVLASGDGNDTIIRGLTFRNGRSASGGCIVISDSATPVIEDCVFIECSSVAMALDETSTNQQAGIGGALFVGGTSAPTVSRCKFFGNSAAVGGGSVWLADTSAAQFKDCLFANETAALYGGSVVSENDSKGRFDNCEWRNNFSQFGGALDGGAVSSTLYTNSRFYNNSAGTGAVIYHYESSTEQFYNCTFIGNSAKGNGGVAGLTATASPSYFDCTFEENSAGGIGAVFYMEITSTLFVKGSLVTRNRALAGGGALSGRLNAAAVFQDSQIMYNSAGSIAGGFDLADDVVVTVTSVTFAFNTCDTSSGAVNLQGNAVFNATDTRFLNNTAATSGGALLVSGNSGMTLERCHLTGNTAAASGGGLYFASIAKGAIHDSYFAENLAAVSGGGIALHSTGVPPAGTTFSVKNTTLVSNVAITGGAIAVDSSVPLALNGSGMYNNIGRFGGAMWMATGGNTMDCETHISKNEAKLIDPPVGSAISYTSTSRSARFVARQIVAASDKDTTSDGDEDGSETAVVDAGGGGGGVFYSGAKRFLTCPEGTCAIYGNTASYGSNEASSAVRLITSPQWVKASPRQTISITAAIHDLFGNLVTDTQEEITISLTPAPADPSLTVPITLVGQGISKKLIEDGTAVFGPFAILGLLGGLYNLGVSSDNLLSTNVPVRIATCGAAALVMTGFLIRYPALCKSSISATLVFFVQYSYLLLPASPQFTAMTQTLNLTFDWINDISGTTCILRLSNFEKLLFGGFYPLVGISSCVIWAIFLKAWYFGKDRWDRRNDIPVAGEGVVRTGHTMPKKAVIAWINAFLFIILWAYLLLSRVILQILSCSYIADEHVVSEAPDQPCRQGIHKTWWALAWVAVLVWVVGLPLFLLGFLKWALLTRARGGTRFWVEALEQIYADFKPRYWFFEFVFLARKLGVVLLDVYTVFDPTAKAVSALIFAFTNLLTLAFVVRPWRRTRDNRMEELLLLILLLEAGLSLGDSALTSGVDYTSLIKTLQVAGLMVGVGVTIFMAIPRVRRTLRRIRYSYLGPLDEPTVRRLRRPPTVSEGAPDGAENEEDSDSGGEVGGASIVIDDAGCGKCETPLATGVDASTVTLHTQRSSELMPVEPDMEQGKVSPLSILKKTISSRRGSIATAQSRLSVMHTRNLWITDKQMSLSLLSDEGQGNEHGPCGSDDPH